MSENVNDLFEAAQDEGMLSGQSASVLAVGDIGKKIQQGMGVAVGNIEASEVVLVSGLLDDSGSIRFSGNTQAVRDGANRIRSAVKGSNDRDKVMLMIRSLNRGVIHPYVLVEQAPDIDTHNYNPDGGTPLYGESVVLLGSVIAKAQEFSDHGVGVRTATLIMSDGAATDQDPDRVRTLVEDMLRQETHIIAAMGVYDGDQQCPNRACRRDLKAPGNAPRREDYDPDDVTAGPKCPGCGRILTATNFRAVFRRMGIRDEWILTTGNNEHDIREAFGTFSRVSQAASQHAGNFSEQLGGGFAASNVAPLPSRPAAGIYG